MYIKKSRGDHPRSLKITNNYLSPSEQLGQVQATRRTRALGVPFSLICPPSGLTWGTFVVFIVTMPGVKGGGA